MKYNKKNIEKIAWRVVEDMTRGNLEMFVYEEIFNLLEKDEEIFNLNVELYKGK